MSVVVRDAKPGSMIVCLVNFEPKPIMLMDIVRACLATLLVFVLHQAILVLHAVNDGHPILDPHGWIF